MDLNDFTINSHIEFCEDNITYISIVQDKDNDSITINIPYSGNKYYPLHPRMKVFFTRIDTTCVFKYSGIVTETKLEQSIQLFTICNICFIEKLQRRNYYRHAISLPIDYCTVPKHMQALNVSQIMSCLNGNMIHSVTKDISGGSLCLVLKNTCSINDKLIISFKAGKNQICTICTIVRIWKDKETFIEVAGLKFIDITESTRDKIIQYIFEKMVSNKKLFS